MLEGWRRKKNEREGETGTPRNNIVNSDVTKTEILTVTKTLRLTTGFEAARRRFSSTIEDKSNDYNEWKRQRKRKARLKPIKSKAVERLTESNIRRFTVSRKDGKNLFKTENGRRSI